MDAAADTVATRNSAVGDATAVGTVTKITVNIVARRSATAVIVWNDAFTGATVAVLTIGREFFINSKNEKSAENIRAFYFVFTPKFIQEFSTINRISLISSIA